MISTAMPTFEAMEKGFFKNHGLDVKLIAPSNPNDPPKLLHRPRTAFPSLLSNRLPRFDREATGKQTMPGSVKQLPPPARIEPGRGRTDPIHF